MQRQHQRAAVRQRRLGAADLRHAGQEGEDVAIMLRQRGTHRAGHRLGQIARVGDIARRVADLHREHAAGAFDHDRVQQAGQTRAIRSRRHGDQPQLRPQHALEIAAQRECQVGFQRALVHLVENHGGDAVQSLIGQQATDQQAFGDDLDASG